jgi:TonB family protein
MRARGRRVRQWCGVALLAALPWLALAQTPADPGCRLADGMASRTPIYPVDELWRLSNHTVTVLLEADGCGIPLSVELERSSGITTLDAQALEAAREWIIPPDWRGRPRYRLPFDFAALPVELQAQQDRRVRDPFFEERRAGEVQLAEVTELDPAKGLPGYLHDPYPIGFFSLQEALGTLHSLGVVKRYGDMVDIWLSDEEGVSLFQWYGHLLVRNRQVQQEGMTFVVSSALCGNDLEVCRQRLGQVQSERGRQFPQQGAALP